MNLSISQMVKDISRRRSAVKRINEGKPRPTDGPLLAQMAAIVLAEIDQQGPIIPASIPLGSAIRDDLFGIMAQLKSSLQKLSESLPMLIKIVKKGRADTNEEMELGGTAAVMAVSLLLLAGMVDDQQVLVQQLIQLIGESRRANPSAN